MGDTRIKTIMAMFKTLEAGEKTSDGTTAKAGQFEAIVSVFDNVDQYGDVIKKGAFKRTLADWAATGDPIPVYYSHRLDDPDMNIGWSLDAQERNAKGGLPPGLWTLTQADLDNPKAQRTYDLMAARRLTQFSFSYNVPDGGEKYIEPEDPDADPWETGDFGHFELTDLTLYEYGPTPVGANPDTVLIGTKSGGQLLVPRRALALSKAGKVLSSKNLSALQDARDILDQVITDANESDKAGRRRQKDDQAAPPDPGAPPADDPAPTIDDVQSSVQDAADSLADALDAIEGLSSKAAPAPGADGQERGTARSSSRNPVAEAERLLALADSLLT